MAPAPEVVVILSMNTVVSAMAGRVVMKEREVWESDKASIEALQPALEVFSADARCPRRTHGMTAGSGWASLIGRSAAAMTSWLAYCSAKTPEERQATAIGFLTSFTLSRMR